MANSPPPATVTGAGFGGKRTDMGSRKKKIIIPTQKIAFLGWYKSLSVNEKIAFKTWIYYYGRGRYRLQDLFKPNKWWTLCLLGRQNAIIDCYIILWSRPWPDLQRWAHFVPR